MSVTMLQCVSCHYRIPKDIPSGPKAFNAHMQRYHQGQAPEFTEHSYANEMEAMFNDDMAPTAPLDKFVKAYSDDDNVWWRTDGGHHMNLFDEALERIYGLTKLVEEMLPLILSGEDRRAARARLESYGLKEPR